jgi:hypothetical protein
MDGQARRQEMRRQTGGGTRGMYRQTSTEECMDEHDRQTDRSIDRGMAAWEGGKSEIKAWWEQGVDMVAFQ